ncbi:MAG: SCP2 sterol-binding domain-containing protein [Hyphomicrobiales bacterium]|nr:SCP2 sterol-binding domain-containing protein [Hyphomicrobiales bacterium]MCP5370215.1 SCP2 sterol-binding domain-containing protein [Hyphomicrobiales bacterium]
MRPLPLAPLRRAVALAMAAVNRRHPDLFERLAGLEDPVFLIDPADLPLAFLLRPRAGGGVAGGAAMEVVGEGGLADAPPPTATIRGPLLDLIDLLEGRIDGDALFFNRVLTVEGDTEAVVALRNAVDGAGIDLRADLLAALGPLAGPAGVLLDGGARLLRRAGADLETLRAALVAPLHRRQEAQAATLRRLEETVAAGSASPPGRARRRAAAVRNAGRDAP